MAGWEPGVPVWAGDDRGANMSPVSGVVTQHITDLITPQYQRDTAANMSQLPLRCDATLSASLIISGRDGSNQPASLVIIVSQPKHLDRDTPILMKTTQTEQRDQL